MNGAHSLTRTLVDAGVTTCFANPGTSEMPLVAALDSAPDLRGVLCLFEGVATGAADGYGRMLDRPAATLLHLGPGLAYGWPNLHNARRARSPILTIIGDHATAHKNYDPPLESDIDALAAAVSTWVRRCDNVTALGRDAAEGAAAAMTHPTGVATLIVPADVARSSGGDTAKPVPAPRPRTASDESVQTIAKTLRSGEPAVLFLGGRALRRDALAAANRVARATGARLVCETLPARRERGAGTPAGVEHLAFAAHQATAQLAGTRHLLLAGAPSPVTFFHQEGQPSSLVPHDCQVHVLADSATDVTEALAHLADLVATEITSTLQHAHRPDPPTGALTGETFAAAIAALLPEGAIVCDESNTAGSRVYGATETAPPHDWMLLAGGSIGYALPAAIGAAIACPDRKVLSLVADGSAMYTLPALWTHAREGLDITTVIANNRSYNMLELELARYTPQPGPVARSLLDLSRPDLDFTAIATGMGIPATRADTAEDFYRQLGAALAEPGPHLIEALVPPLRL